MMVSIQLFILNNILVQQVLCEERAKDVLCRRRETVEHNIKENECTYPIQEKCEEDQLKVHVS